MKNPSSLKDTAWLFSFRFRCGYLLNIRTAEAKVVQNVNSTRIHWYGKIRATRRAQFIVAIAD